MLTEAAHHGHVVAAHAIDGNVSHGRVVKEPLDFVLDAEQQAVVVAGSDFLQQRVQRKQSQ